MGGAARRLGASDPGGSRPDQGRRPGRDRRYIAAATGGGTAERTRPATGHPVLRAGTRRGPTFAPAYAGMANAYVQARLLSLLAPDDAFPKAGGGGSKALESIRRSPNHMPRWLRDDCYYDWEWPAADRDSGRHRAEPSYATAHEWYGLFPGRHGPLTTRPGAEERPGQGAGPALPGNRRYHRVGCCITAAGRMTRSACCDQALGADSTYGLGRLYLGRVLQAKGELDSAVASTAGCPDPVNSGYRPWRASETYTRSRADGSEAVTSLRRLDSLSTNPVRHVIRRRLITRHSANPTAPSPGSIAPVRSAPTGWSGSTGIPDGSHCADPRSRRWCAGWDCRRERGFDERQAASQCRGGCIRRGITAGAASGKAGARVHPQDARGRHRAPRRIPGRPVLINFWRTLVQALPGRDAAPYRRISGARPGGPRDPGHRPHRSGAFAQGRPEV